MQLRALLDSALGETDAATVGEAVEVDETDLQEIMTMLVNAIRSGDEDTYGTIIASSRLIDENDPLAVEYDQAMWAKRNISMAQSIAELLEAPEDEGGYFAVIGAGHLFGDDSVLVLLEDLGYQIVRVK